MTQAILEISSMLIGALAIGVFFSFRYWKAKFDELKDQMDRINSDLEKSAKISETLEQELASLKSNHEKELNKLKKEFKREKEELKSSHDSETVKLHTDNEKLTKQVKKEQNKIKKSDKERKEFLHTIELKDEQLGEKERELEEVTKHFHTHNISYYKQIDGKRYKAATLHEADDSVAGVGDGRISKADAEKIFATISDGHTYTQVEKDTMHYIRENYKWTPESDELFRKKVRSWAAKGHQLDVN